MAATKSSTEVTDQETHVEGWKLYFDFCKHLTTLNTASILLLVTFLEKLFTNPSWKGLVIVAFGFFVISIITSVMAMSGFAAAVRDKGQHTRFDKNHDAVTLLIGAISFICGLACVIIFAAKNLYG